MSEANVVDMAVEVEPFRQYSVKFCYRATEGQSDKMASDMEVRMKQRRVTEFLHAEKFAPSDIHRRLLNVYGDQTVDVSTVRLVRSCMVQKWQLRIRAGYITKMGDYEIKGNESKVALDLQQARIRALNYVVRR
jgi:hypothetical protein